MTKFRKDLEALLNAHSMENGCDTPDHILADYLQDCLAAFDSAVIKRERWYGRGHRDNVLDSHRELNPHVYGEQDGKDPNN